MNGANAFEQAVAEAVDLLGPARLRVVAHGIALRKSRPEIAALVPVPGYAEAARVVLDGQRDAAVPDADAVAYLRGVAAGYAQRADAVQVESVWSGPSSHSVPIRATAQVIVALVAEATSDVLLMTYSAKPYPPVLDALCAAVERGVDVSIVVETLQGAGSALAGAEPAAAFQSVSGAQLWHWPVTARAEPGAKMHAKLAIADRRVLLVSSANLTQAGVGKNIEAGLLVRGGSAPVRAAEHVEQLKASGTLTRL